jgi:hypothetical protein
MSRKEITQLFIVFLLLPCSALSLSSYEEAVKSIAKYEVYVDPMTDEVAHRVHIYSKELEKYKAEVLMATARFECTSKEMSFSFGLKGFRENFNYNHAIDFIELRFDEEDVINLPKEELYVSEQHNLIIISPLLWHPAMIADELLVSKKMKLRLNNSSPVIEFDLSEYNGLVKKAMQESQSKYCYSVKEILN